jgi:hypothetical protein
VEIRYSSDADHARTIELLEEALDYLLRLPTVPATYHLCKRLEAHLDEPVQQQVQGSQRRMSGMLVTACGRPIFDAQLIDDMLTLTFPQRAGDPTLPPWQRAKNTHLIERSVLQLIGTSVAVPLRTGQIQTLFAA